MEPEIWQLGEQVQWGISYHFEKHPSLACRLAESAGLEKLATLGFFGFTAGERALVVYLFVTMLD